MKSAIYKSYDELPLLPNAETVAKLLSISPSTGYELMHEKGFPVLRIGFRAWWYRRRSSRNGWKLMWVDVHASELYFLSNA